MLCIVSNSVVKSFAKKYKMSVPEVERLWQTAKAAASDTLDPSSPDFYAPVVSILKKILKGKAAKVAKEALENKMDEMKLNRRRRRLIRETRQEHRLHVRELRKIGRQEKV